MLKSILLLSLCLTLTISFILPTTSSAEWTKVAKSVSGNTFYVDFERIRKHDGYVYYWGLMDYLKPLSSKFLSDKAYIEGDCNLFRLQYLSISYHKEPMGRGTTDVTDKRSRGWQYPSPKSVMEAILKKVCNYAKGMK